MQQMIKKYWKYLILLGLITAISLVSSINFISNNKKITNLNKQLILVKKQKGPAGKDGEVGLPGPQGDRGPQGPAGVQGLPGKDGEAGQHGLPGSEGKQGPQGETGAQGPEGKQGPQGNRGPQGDRGLPGLKGDKGEPGKDGTQITNDDLLAKIKELDFNDQKLKNKLTQALNSEFSKYTKSTELTELLNDVFASKATTKTEIKALEARVDNLTKEAQTKSEIIFDFSKWIKELQNKELKLKVENNRISKVVDELAIGFSNIFKTLKEQNKALKELKEHNKALKVRLKNSWIAIERNRKERIQKLEDRLNSKIDWYENKIKENKIAFGLINKSQPPESELHQS